MVLPLIEILIELSTVILNYVLFRTNPGNLSNLNEHLFGPYWPESVRSLLKCAEAAYAFNGNSYRPLRPNADESPQTNSTGSATCIEAEQLNSISDSYDIYCKKAQLEAGNKIVFLCML